MTVKFDGRWTQVNLSDLRAHGIYLDASVPKNRVALLRELASTLGRDSATGARHDVLLGDFNLAPEPRDGLYDGQPSGFTTAGEREALKALQGARDLVDLHRAVLGDASEFTFERAVQGRPSRWRCDLALVPRDWLSRVELEVLHEVRGGLGLTDHSALLLRIRLP